MVYIYVFFNVVINPFLGFVIGFYASTKPSKQKIKWIICATNIHFYIVIYTKERLTK
jgi:hypothetical protein